jgi:Protein of unknown function (DUF1573)
MPRLLVLLLLLGALGTLVACSPGRPDIDVAASYDLGTIAKGEVASVELPVRNVGGGTLTVASVSTSCGCTTAELAPLTIPAGGAGTLRLAYDSAVHDADLGAIERYVFIASDDPDEADTQIKFTVFVQAG